MTSLIPYIQHGNSFSPGTALSWSLISSGLYVASIPASSILVGMRDLTNLPMGSVAGSGLLSSPKLYWYDYSNSKVYIKPNGLIEAWADLLYSYPILKFRELVVQEDQGVLPSYKGLDYVSIIRGDQSVNLYNTMSSGYSGYLTNPLTNVNTGDWVVLEYFIQRSYIVRNHRTIHYYTTASSGETLTINYETSVPDLIPSIETNQPTTATTFNLNPMLWGAFRAGFLMHSNTTTPATALWEPHQVVATLSKTEVCSDWGEHLKFTGYVLDKAGLPVPWYPITLTYTSSATAIVRTPTAAMRTVDGRGEIHCLFKPGSGSVFSVSLTASGITDSASALVLTQSQKLVVNRFLDGMNNLVITDQFRPSRYFQAYVNNTYLDGIPKSASITVRSRLASLFDYNNNLFTASTVMAANSTLNNVTGVASFGFLPQPLDKVIAIYQTASSPIQEMTS